MNDRIANPKSLGFGAFAIGAWMYSMVSAGWFAPSVLGSETAASMAVFVTFALLVAALACFLRGETWHAVFFMFWSAVWWGIQGGGGFAVAELGTGYLGWYFLMIFLFSLLLWLAAKKSAAVGTPAALVALGTAVAELAWGLNYLGLGDFLLPIAGYVGLVTAILAFWAAADDLEVLGGAPRRQAGGAGGEF